MNSLPGTLGRPNLLGLAAAAAEEDFRQPGPPPTLEHVRNSFDDAEINASAPSQHARDGVGIEVVPCPTGTELRALTKAVCRGDEPAFTRFYHLYRTRLYLHLLVLAKGNEGDAREVLQTVVLKVAKRFEIFDDERRLWGWLCRLARNAYVDLCRTRRREQRFVPLEECKSELTAGQEAEHRMAESLRYALDQLAGEDRELMRSAYVDKRPLQELAEASGQTYKAMESRLARLRQKLKTKLLNHLRHENRS